MNFCCACLLCALALATATDRAAEPHPSQVSPILGANWTVETA
jgi:hypothetical protein